MNNSLADFEIKSILTDHIKANSSLSGLSACLAALIFSFKESTLQIDFKYPHYKSFYKSQFQRGIESLLYQSFGNHISINYRVVKQEKTPERERLAFSPTHDPFSRFIPGARNGPVLAAARLFCEGQAPATLILTGPSGCGKSLLLNCIAIALVKLHGHNYARIQSAARFTDRDLSNEIWSDSGAIVLDDLQDIAGDAQKQQKLATCMDSSLKHNGRIAFALCGNDLGIFTARLMQRLSRGLVLEIFPPDLSTRIAFTEKIAKSLGLNLKREQILALSRHSSQLSTIEGLLQKFRLYAMLDPNLPDPETLEKLTLSQNSAPGWQRILMRVAERLEIKPADIIGASRRQEFVIARQAAMFLCRLKLGLSYPELGRIFGGRDHSTVMHGIKKIQRLRQTDRVLHNLLTELEMEGE